jgi:integrase
LGRIEQVERVSERRKLTKRCVTELTVTGTEYTILDTEVQGFHVRVSRAGAKSYAFRYKLNGRTRRLKLGDAAVLTADEARKLAIEARARFQRGEDPAQERKDARDAMTMNRFWEVYYTRHAEPKTRPRTLAEYERVWMTALKPCLGTLQLPALTTDLLEKQIMERHRRTPYKANRALSLLSAMLSKAVLWGYIERNPCRGIARNPEYARDIRPLSADEHRALLRALDEERREGDFAAAVAFELIMFTGARQGEVLHARWAHFEFHADGRAFWNKLATDTKQKRVARVPLVKSIADRIRVLHGIARPTDSTHYICPSLSDPAVKRYDLKSPWRRVRKAAGLETLRLHDLRHDFISSLAIQGVPLETVGRVAGHNNIRTTQRYAHFADAALEAVTAVRGEMLANARARPGSPQQEGLKFHDH